MIELHEPPPILVVEVVGESTGITDYRAKQVEYNGLNSPEYWVIDPLESKVTIFPLIEELYEGAEFAVLSRLFPVSFQS